MPPCGDTWLCQYNSISLSVLGTYSKLTFCKTCRSCLIIQCWYFLKNKIHIGSWLLNEEYLKCTIINTLHPPLPALVAGIWRSGGVWHSPGTYPLACCFLLRCWCTSCWREQTRECCCSAQWHVCRREIVPCRCPGWSSTDCLCRPPPEMWKYKCQRVWLSHLTAHIKRYLIGRCNQFHFEKCGTWDSV